MTDEDDSLQIARAGFEDLCRALNMDEEAANEAWKTYESISRNFTLEGSELHWLACSLYVACRSSVPTVGKGTSEGNYVSLTRILRCSEMSLIEFFNKMKKWQDMANLPQEFRQSTNKLERNFTVSAVIFKKYVPIFKSIFKAPSEEPPRKFLMTPPFFDDLVNSYHLLLCALDLVLTNALLCNARKELLNPNFKGLPEDFSSKDYRPCAGPYCFMEQLCKLHDGLVLEAKGVKEHFWKPFIKKLFHKRVRPAAMLSPCFNLIMVTDQCHSQSRVYEEHILATGSLDERIFTGEGASEEIGTPGPCLYEGLENQNSAISRLHVSLTASALKVATPLTGRKYIQENVVASPISTAMNSVGRLHTLLSGTQQGPSAKLAETFRACARDPSDVITRRLQGMFELFSQHFEVKYFHLAEALYYRTLESIIEREKMILGNADLSCILEQDVFHRSLLVCCLEIVIFSYRPPGDFPNLISIFQLPAYHFYKVIEVLVRSEQGLFREVVKHLNQVEEQVLESLAWTSNSPLWETLRGAKDQVPACKQVMPPQYLEQNNDSSSGSLPITPVNQGQNLNIGSALKGMSPSPTTLLDRYSSPPVGPFRRRLFVEQQDSQPGATAKNGVSTAGPAPATLTKVDQPGLITAITARQGVVTVGAATMTAENGQTLTIPMQGIANESGGITLIPLQVSVSGQGGATLHTLPAQTLTGTVAVQSAVTKAATKPISPLRKGSLSLFFRKLYHMASVRLRDLCAKLDISAELRRKIWTCFEYSLVHCTNLMMDRHLDQLLMCAVYIMSKVTKEDRSFQNIMKCYRTQPQAGSNVYRCVLISGRRKHQSGSNGTKKTDSTADITDGDNSPVPVRSSSTLPTSQPGSAPSTPTSNSIKTLPSSLPGGEVEEKEEQGDLIHFYNQVYVKQMRSFALRYSVSSLATVDSPPLCPYPTLRTGSPRRMLLSSKHSIFISPHKTGSTPSASPRDKIYYYICSSPPNRLQEINSMIRTGESPTKKRSIPLEEETSAKRICSDSHSALLRRLQDVANDRSSTH
uniref:RB transcriptional corepressor like 2 n=1 Tax=Takifugu rubripes TaxID=31033 RepID=A0A674MSQ5_TAKRU